MQAVIALCHFCENHGPQVVFTFQPVPVVDSGEGPSMIKKEDGAQSTYSTGTPDDHLNCIRSNNQFIAQTLPFPVYESDDSKLLQGVRSDRELRCSACSSLGDSRALVSVDKATKTTFVGTQVSFDERVYERVKYSCLRSLTIEVGTAPQRNNDRNVPRPPPRPGEMTLPLGMDGVNCEADGNVFFGDVEHGYTMSLTFRMADSRARGFLRQYSLLVVSSHMQFILHNHDFFISALTSIKSRLQELAQNVFNQEMNVTPVSMRPENASRANMMPQGWFRRKVNVDMSRGLNVITGDENVWHHLHRQMLWTLRTECLRYSEEALEGLPSQDMLVIREMAPERVRELELGHEDEHEHTLDQLENMRRIALYFSNEGADMLERLLYHAITGGQIVVTGGIRWAVRAVLLALSNLLPLGCIKIVAYSDMFRHPYSANLLGMRCETCVPDWATSTMILTVENIVENGDEHESLEGATFKIVRYPSKPLPLQLPQLLQRFKQLLLDTEVAENVLDTTIRAARDGWLNKSKVVFQLVRQPKPIHLPKVLSIARATARDREVLLFFMQHGLSQVFRSKVTSSLSEDSKSAPSSP